MNTEVKKTLVVTMKDGTQIHSGNYLDFALLVIDCNKGKEAAGDRFVENVRYIGHGDDVETDAKLCVERFGMDQLGLGMKLGSGTTWGTSYWGDVGEELGRALLAYNTKNMGISAIFLGPKASEILTEDKIIELEDYDHEGKV